MKRLLLAGTAVLATLVPVAPTAAQQAESGDYSVALMLFDADRGRTFSLGRMFTDRLHVALEFDWQRVDASDRPSTPSVGVKADANTGGWLLGPTVRWYAPARGPVVPYLRAKIGYGLEISDLTLAEEQVRDQETATFQGSIGIGGEWFPVDGIGISGHTGFRWSRENLERYDEDGDLLKRTTTDWGAFRSGLMFTFYFQ